MSIPTLSRLARIRKLVATNKERFIYRAWLAESTTPDEHDCLSTIDPERAPSLLDHSCGTVGCVAGWCCAVGIHEKSIELDPLGHLKDCIEYVARDWLGITVEEARFLFMVNENFGFPFKSLEEATVEDALKRLDFLIKRYIDAQETIYKEEDVQALIAVYQEDNSIIEKVYGNAKAILQAYVKGSETYLYPDIEAPPVQEFSGDIIQEYHKKQAIYKDLLKEGKRRPFIFNAVYEELHDEGFFDEDEELELELELELDEDEDDWSDDEDEDDIDETE